MNTDIRVSDDAALTSPRKFLAEVVGRDARWSKPSNSASARRLIGLTALFALGVYFLAWDVWVAGPAVFLLMGVLQYHLLVGLHEAYHSGLLAPRRLNDRAGTLIAALISFDFETTKRKHLTHHRRYGFPDDPDYPDYELEPGYSSAAAFLFEVVTKPIRNASRRLGGGSADDVPSDGRGRLVVLLRVALVQGTVFLIFATASAWWHYIAFWALPMFLIPGALARIRTFGEHAALTADDLPDAADQFHYARSNIEHRTGWVAALSQFEKSILSPFNFNHHHEHHIVPGVPYHALPHLHKALTESGHYRSHAANLRPSYCGTVLEILREQRNRDLGAGRGRS